MPCRSGQPRRRTRALRLSTSLRPATASQAARACLQLCSPSSPRLFLPSGAVFVVSSACDPLIRRRGACGRSQGAAACKKLIFEALLENHGGAYPANPPPPPPPPPPHHPHHHRTHTRTHADPTHTTKHAQHTAHGGGGSGVSSAVAWSMLLIQSARRSQTWAGRLSRR